MKIKTLVLLLLAKSFIFSEIIPVDKEDPLVDWYWLGTENELYLKLELNEGLKFDDLYFIDSSEKAQRCELSINPLNEWIFQTPKQDALKTIKVLVTVENTDSPKEIFYRVQISRSFVIKETRKVDLVEQIFEDTLLNSTLDVTEDPLFFTFIENSSFAVIRFKNLFKCSS